MDNTHQYHQKIQAYNIPSKEQEAFTNLIMSECSNSMRETMYFMKNWLETSQRGEGAIINTAQGEIIQRIKILQTSLTSQHKFQVEYSQSFKEIFQEIQRLIEEKQKQIKGVFEKLRKMLGLKQQTLQVLLGYEIFQKFKAFLNLSRFLQLPENTKKLLWPTCKVSFEALEEIANSVRQSDSLEDYLVMMFKMRLSEMEILGFKELDMTVEVQHVRTLFENLKKYTKSKAKTLIFNFADIDMMKLQNSIANTKWQGNHTTINRKTTKLDTSRVRQLVSHQFTGIDKLKQHFELQKIRKLLEGENNQVGVGNFKTETKDVHQVNMNQEIAQFVKIFKETLTIQNLIEPQIKHLLKEIAPPPIVFITEPRQVSQMMAAGNHQEWGLFVPRGDRYDFITNVRRMNILSKFSKMIQQSDGKYYANQKDSTLKSLRDMYRHMSKLTQSPQAYNKIVNLFYKIELKVCYRVYERAREAAKNDQIQELMPEKLNLAQLIN